MLAAVASASRARVRLYPAAFDGDSTTWVLLRRLCLVSMPPCRFRGWFAGRRSRWAVFLTLDLVIRCSSTSGAEFEFWCPGTLCGSPVPSTLRRLEILSIFLEFEVMDPVFFLPLLVAPSLEAPQRGPARFCS